jgi:hypothetical protein
MAEAAGSIMLCDCGLHANGSTIVRHEAIVEVQPISILPQMKLKITGLACFASTGVLALFSLVGS